LNDHLEYLLDLFSANENFHFDLWEKAKLIRSRGREPIFVSALAAKTAYVHHRDADHKIFLLKR